MRRQFELGEEDKGNLEARGFQWEAVIEGNAKWLIILSYPIPAGYNHTSSNVALRIGPAYPDEQIDMASFFPALALTTGKNIKNLTELRIDGKPYQQWSRHRTKENPWQIGVDNIGTHLLAVDDWLRRETVG